MTEDFVYTILICWWDNHLNSINCSCYCCIILMINQSLFCSHYWLLLFLLLSFLSFSRLCLRRQSAATYRIQHQEPAENLFEIDYDTFPVAGPLYNSACEDGSYSPPSSEAQEPRRTSIGRPLRSAVEKVESYKERPINIKMRRTQWSLSNLSRTHD